MRELILASESPRRKDILERMGISFRVEPSGFPEENLPELPPKELAEYLSLEKARKISKLHPKSTVIGADTIVVLDDKILGKPKTIEEAKEMLGKLSGRPHIVISAYTIINPSQLIEITTSDETSVSFRKLGNEEINSYVLTGKSMDKAGGYGIQEAGKFIESIEGDYNNVVGLPSKIEGDLRNLDLI